MHRILWLATIALLAMAPAVALAGAPQECGTERVAGACADLEPAVAGSPTLPWLAPQRVLLIGSSSIQHGFGPELRKHLTTAGVPSTSIVAQYSTGLARLDIRDWLAQAQDIAMEQRPDLVVFHFGGNDAQALTTPSGEHMAEWDTEGWRVLYAQRVQRFLEPFIDRGAHIVLLGVSHASIAHYASRMAAVNELLKAIAERTGAAYVSTWDFTTASSGEPLLTWPGPKGDEPLRKDDGLHFAVGADRWAAGVVARRIVALHEPEVCDDDEGVAAVD